MDVEASISGSIATLRPISARAKKWFAANVVTEPWQWFGDSIACEPRMADDIVDALVDNGFEVET